MVTLEVLLSGGGAFAGVLEGIGSVSGSWTVAGAEDWETETWKTVRSFLRLTASGALAGPPPLAFSLVFENETTRKIVDDRWAWPIEESASGTATALWNVSQTVAFHLQGFPSQSNASHVEGSFTTRYEHVRTELLTVPAGTFDAHVIDERGPEGRRVHWFSSRTGSDVRQEEFNETGSRVARSELTAYRYTAAEPPQAFPWLLAFVAALTVVVAVLLVFLARRRRKPVDVWIPPEPASSGPPPGPSP